MSKIYRILDLNDGLAKVSKADKYGFANELGELLIPFVYDDASSFSECLAFAKKAGKQGYINQKGEWPFSIECDWARDFHEGLTAVSKKGRLGFIDKRGDVVIDFQFRDCLHLPFSYGYAWVKGFDASFYIDKKGNRVELIY